MVVGVAPKNFGFPVENPSVELWTTIAQDASAPPPIDRLTAQRGARVLDAFGRLKPGVGLKQARAQMDAIAAALARQYPDNNKNVARTSVKPLLDEVVGFSRTPLLILMGAVGLLLLIACMDVANLLLSRTAERAREFALRAAIGASRAVILRQMLTESLVLGALGSAAGVLFAFASIPLLVRFAAVAVPRLATARVDVRVLFFAIVLALISAVLFSLAPLIQIARIEIVEFIKEGTGGIAGARDRIRHTLVIAQFAFGLVLLSGAGLLAVTLAKIETRDLGFRPDHLLTFRVDLPDAQYPLAQQIAFDDRLMDKLNAIPGVQSTASGWPLPFEGDQASVSFELMDRPAPPPERPHADIAIVTPGFFHTLGIPVVRGRPFTAHDDMDGSPVVIVNQAFAERFFPGQDAIGKCIQSGATNGKGPVIQTIIGIVGNARQSALNRDPDPIYYFPYKQLPWGFGWIVLHTSVPPRNVESAARAAVAAIDPQAPVYKVRTMEDAFSVAIAPARFFAWLLTTFAVIALLLVVVGVYGVMAYSVAKRTREIGVRIAVGADRAAILKMIITLPHVTLDISDSANVHVDVKDIIRGQHGSCIDLF